MAILSSLLRSTFSGDTGPAGPPGPAGTIAVGTVTTLPAGSEATITNVGTTSAAVFNFSIPQGAQGQSGGVTTGKAIAMAMVFG